ncbi:deoxycytidyl transferase [Thelotrema lepadinum]|nr:deoxycytidyl transferase [Thelotrema lepadinum]
MGSRLEANSSTVRKRISSHKFEDEGGEEYSGSKFGGFGEYFRRKKIKLQNRDTARREAAADKPKIFRGVVAHVNGYTQPSLNDLHNLIVDHGGGFLQYLDGKTMVTHVIASNLTPKKKVEFRKYRIVKPAWVVDSIKAGRLLPWDRYRVVDEGVKQNVLGLRDGSMVSQASTQQAGYRDQTDTSWYTGQMKDVAGRLNENARDELPFPSSQYPRPPKLPYDVDRQDDDRHYHSAEQQPHVKFEGGDEQKPDKDEVNDFMSDDLGILEANLDSQDAIESTDNAEDDLVEGNEKISLSEPSVIKAQDTGQDVLDIHEEVADVVPVPADESKTSIPAEAPELPCQESIELEVRPESKRPSDLLAVGDNVSPSKKHLTAEEHNATLLKDPKVWKSTVVNPGFLKQYYEESRLHHLSTWKAELKSQMQALAREQSSSQQARRKRPPGARRYIFHVDFDSFFTAVSLKSHPEWVDKPAVVAHGSGSGSEIASCNYPARAFGVKNGMWMKAALEMCPELKVLPYDFKAYEAASRDFYDVILNSGGIVQSVSVDEALIDLSVACVVISGSDGKGQSEGSVYREQAKAEEIAREMRSKIREKTGCEISIGIGGSILLAKIALRKAKPAGQFLVKPEAILDILGNLTVQELPGVAHSIGGKLEEIGVKYVKDIRELTKEKLMTTLGPKTGEKLWDYSRGIDRAEVGDQVIRKSVSAEVNWGVRFVTQEQADEFVTSLCEEVQKRLLNEAVKGRQLTMKIMRRSSDSPLDPPKHLGHGKCDVYNRSVILGVPTYDFSILAREAISIMKGYGFPPGELRGIGVQVTRLEPLKKQAPAMIGSQRPLQFKKPTKPPLRDEVEDSIESPQKPTRIAMHPAAALSASNVGDEAASLLNTSGTQFILPTQVDPEVLAELPEDIRAQLARRQSASSKPDAKQPRLNFKGKSNSPTPQPQEDMLLTASQLDQETLAALPSDLRAEVLGYYKKQSPQKPTTVSKQAILPQSPHKNRTIKLSTKTTPTKPKPGLLGRGRGRPKKGSETKSTLTQANFVSRLPGDSEASASDAHDSSEISADFLAALPEDIRAEVLEQQRRSRLKKRGNLDLVANRKKALRPPPGPYVPRTVPVLPRPARPVFTSQKLTNLPELRDAVSAWYREWGGDEEPDGEDVAALGGYLRRVVLEERDLGKAESVCRWLEWVVGRDGNGDGEGKPWRKAVEDVKGALQGAVAERGLGPVEF